MLFCNVFKLHFYHFTATGCGDPHFITLDGVEYTFNGFGEYTVLNINATNFNLQGRMQPLTDSGRSSRATLFSAFAMKENDSDIVEVCLCYSLGFFSLDYPI